MRTVVVVVDRIGQAHERIQGLIETSSGPMVVILCGGRGSRLKPLTDILPKALCILNDRPIVDHVIDFYACRGFSHFTLCVGYKADMVRDHFRESPLDICFSDAGEDASMLQRIWAIRERIEDHVIVSYCDTFVDLNIDDLLDQHRKSDLAATIVTADIRSPFGLVDVDSGSKVRSFREKPLLTYYIGCFVISAAALAYVTEDMLAEPDGQGLVSLFSALAAADRLSAFNHDGLQITFSTESELRKAEKDLGHFYTLLEES